MSALCNEMRQSIIELAGERDVFDSRERWLARAARAAGISPRMAKAFFYRECGNPSAEVVEKVRAAKNRKTDHAVSAAARGEYEQLVARIERLEVALRISDS